VVVGAGSAGCVIAKRLAAAGHSVLVLEAGDDDSSPFIKIPGGFYDIQRTALDWAFESTPQEALGGRVVFLPRGKVLGGSSSMNAMLWVRGHQENYNGWARAGVCSVVADVPGSGGRGLEHALRHG
jgi:choline dehydrogenase